MREELKAEVRTVGESVVALEQRMAPIEADVHRSATGVEVLCELVASSGLLSNASPDSLRRLDDFTGKDVLRSPAEPAALPPPPRPELLEPAELRQPLSQSAPGYLRSLLDPAC